MRRVTQPGNLAYIVEHFGINPSLVKRFVLTLEAGEMPTIDVLMYVGHDKVSGQLEPRKFKVVPYTEEVPSKQYPNAIDISSVSSTAKEFILVSERDMKISNND